MKTLLGIAICITIASSCNKEKDMKQLRYRFSGTWEYERYNGYPFVNTYLPPGNGRIIVLSENGDFQRKNNDTVLFKGRYAITSKNDCNQRENNWFFTTNDTIFQWGDYIEIQNDRLVLSTPNCFADGGSVFYRKLK